MSLETDITLLRQASPLNALNADALRLLAFAADMRMLRAGDILFRKGDRSDGAYIVRSGQIALDASGDGTGKGAGEPYLAHAGCLIGRTSLFTRILRPATAKALEPCSIMRLPPSLIQRVWEEFPQALLHMRKVLSEDLMVLCGQLGKVQNRLLMIDHL
jgi:CRP-like cAMP-binding protein